MTLITHMCTGEGEPVVLLNGGLMTIASWEPIAGPLSAKYRVIRCDFRGQLLSPGVPPWTVEGHVADVVAVLDELGLSRVHVVGVSFGGIIGLAMAATRPERVMSLVAGNTTAQVQETDWASTQPLLEACRAADGGLMMDRLIPLMYSDDFRRKNEALFALIRSRASAFSSQYFSGLEGLLLLLKGLDLRPIISTIRCNTLIIAAEHDRVFPLPRSLELLHAISGARLETIPGTHALFLEEPARIVGTITAFLENVRG